MNFMDDKLFDMIRRHEGLSDKIYLDSVGVPTGGYGHAFLVGSPITIDIAEKFFQNDIFIAEQNYKTLKLNLDETRKMVIINMIFNLGLTRFLKFKKFIHALNESNWQKAHDEMINSRWAAQVGNRAKELANIMLTGEYNK